MAQLRQNTWTLDQWYDQDVAGNVSYSGIPGLYTVGWNYTGALGLNTAVDRYSSPVQIPGTTWDYVSNAISGDSYHLLSSKTDGTLWAWGNGGHGGLGQENTTDYSSPVQVGSDTTWGSELGTHANSSFAIKTDGTLWSWGYNAGYGDLGHNNKTNYSSPKQVPGTWSTLSILGGGCITTKPDGTLWTWGTNGQGQLGHNNKTGYSSPKQVPGTTWTGDISAGGQYGGAIKSDGTLWLWGVNEFGMLGQNNQTKYSSPIQVGSETTWSKLGFALNTVSAIKTDGTLWSWGINSTGQSAQNNTVSYSSPVQIPGTTWANVVGGQDAIHATKTDGTLWAWGGNGFGQLAQNSEIEYSSPVQIPGNWKTAKGKLGNARYGLALIADI